MTARKLKSVNMRDLAKELDATSKEHIELLKEATLSGIAKSIPMLVERSPVDTGLYAQSWQFHKEEWGAVLGNYAPHAPIIEFGAMPFTPPIAPLLAWAKRVLQDNSQPPEHRKGLKESDGYSDRVWALAKYTQKKISLEGMKPKHILTDAIPEIIENIRKEYQALGE